MAYRRFNRGPRRSGYGRRGMYGRRSYGRNSYGYRRRFGGYRARSARRYYYGGRVY